MTCKGLIIFRLWILFVTILFFAINDVSAQLKLGYRDFGICFGNSPEFNGIRINIQDADVRSMNGLNLTLWKPLDNSNAQHTGISLGVIGPAARRIKGLAIGGVAVNADTMQGISFALVGAAHSYFYGCSVTGIGIASGRTIGFVFSGIGGAYSDASGIFISGIGLAARDVTGIAFGGVGLAVETMNGLGIGLIGLAAEEVNGIVIGGAGVASDKIRGFALSANLDSEEVTGAAVSILKLKVKRFKGIGVGAYCRYQESLEGISIGLVNLTPELKGFQFGLINYAGNNHKLLRILPLLNFHL